MDVSSEDAAFTADKALTDEDWEAWRDNSDPVVVQIIHCHEMMMSLLFRDSKRAIETALRVAPHQVGRLSVIIPIHFSVCLGLLGQLPNLDDKERQRILAQAEAHLKSIGFGPQPALSIMKTG